MMPTIDHRNKSKISTYIENTKNYYVNTSIK